MLSEKDFLKKIEDLNDDHKEDGYPAVRMEDINRLLEIIYKKDEIIERLEDEILEINQKEE